MKIAFEKVSKYYRGKGQRVTAVNNLSWRAERGRVYGILGPNGSGKTSMIRMLLNLIQPDSGQILVNDSVDFNSAAEFRQSLGYLPEERGLYRKQKVLEVLVYFGQLKGLSSLEARNRARQFLERLELAAHEDQLIQSLSKGMSQKVQLIATLLHEPQLVILDEPFTGLDPKNVTFIREFIAERRAAGALVLLCTHRMDEAEKLCDDILMLNKGRLVLSGPQNEIRQERGVRIRLDSSVALDQFSSVKGTSRMGRHQEVELRSESSVGQFLEELSSLNGAIHDLQVTPVSLEELYLRAVEERVEGDAQFHDS